MLAQYARRLACPVLALLVAASAALAEDTAQELKNQALADIASIRDGSSGAVRSHLNDAIRALSQTTDSFIDGNHVASHEVFERFHQAAEAIRQAARRSQVEVADRLNADGDRLAGAARLLATTLLGEVQGDTRPVDRKSASKRARTIEKADREVARGDAESAFEPAIQRFRDAWKEAVKAGRFRVRLDSVSDAPDPFNPQRTSNTLTARFEARLKGDAQTLRTEWTILSASGDVLRRIVGETPVPRRQGQDPRVGEVVASLVFDGKADAGAALADGTYSYRVTGSILPEEDEDEDDEDEDEPCERGNCLDGYLTGSVTIDIVAPSFGPPRPPAGSIGRDAQPEVGIDFSDAVSGVDPASVRLVVGGIDVTASSTITTTGVSYTPTAPFLDGRVEARATAADPALNVAQAAWSFLVDTTAPEWRGIQPEDQAVLENRRVSFRGTPFDEGSGVDPSSVRLRLDGEEVTARAQIEAGLVSFTPATDLPDGEHAYEADFADVAGNPAPTLVRRFRVVSAVGPVDPAQGGTIEVTDPESPVFGVAIEIPPGVAPSDLTAIISIPELVPPLPQGDAGIGTAVEIEAEPSNFASPVTLVFPYDEADLGGLPEEGIRVAFFEESSGQWEFAEDFTVDTQANVVIVRTLTLSTWTLLLPPPKPPTMVEISGSGQSGQSGMMLVGPLRAMVRDGEGKPVAGVKVTFTTDAPGGLFADDPNLPPQPGPQLRQTTADGVVQLYFQLGTNMGEQHVDLTAVVAGSKLQLRFTVQAVPPPPQLKEISGSGQSGPAGSLLPSPLRAQLLDGAGKPLPGVKVTISSGAAAGGYFVDGPAEPPMTSPLDRLTDTNGIVQIYYGLDSTPGLQRVQFLASVSGSELLLTFSVQATTPPPPPPTSAELKILSGDRQTGSPGSVLPQPLRALAQDSAGVPIAGLLVHIESSDLGSGFGDDPKGAFKPTPVDRVTGADGVVQIYYQLGPSAGLQEVKMVAEFNGKGLGTTFVVNPGSKPPPPSAKMTATQGDNQSGAPGAVLPVPLAAVATDGAGVPLAGLTVTISCTPADGSFASDAQGPFFPGVNTRVTGADGSVWVYYRLAPTVGVQAVRMETAYAGTQLSAVFKLTALGPHWEMVHPHGGGEPTANRREPFSAIPVGGAMAVDLASIRLRLDGNDVTAQATITETGVQFTPTTSLQDGLHRYEAEMSDLSGATAPLLTALFNVVSAMGNFPPQVGGTVTVTESGNRLQRVAVEVPPGASLDKPTIITIAKTSSPAAPDGWIPIGEPAEINMYGGPASGKFAVPVTVRFPFDLTGMANATEDELVLAHFDERSGTWIVPEDLALDGDYILGRTTSLSTWRVFLIVATMNVSPTRSTFRVIPSTMQVGGTAICEVIPRRYGGALSGSGRSVQLSFVAGQGTLGPVRDLGNGIYEADLTAPQKTGTARLRATVQGVQLVQEPVVTYSSTASAYFTLSKFPASTAAGQQNTFVLEARDAFGNIATGYSGTVRFSCSDAQATIDGAPASTYMYKFPGDGSAEGQATLVLVLRTAGTATFVARDSLDPTVQGTGSITVRPGPPSTFTVLEGDRQLGLAGARLPLPLRARVADAFGNPIGGEPVTVRVASGGGRLQRDLGFDPEPGPLSLRSGANGEVRTYWVVGQAGEPQVLEMQPASAGLPILTFNATAAVDETPPTITFDFPSNFALLNTGVVPVRVSFIEDLSGVDPDTADILVNNVSMREFAQVGEGGIQLDLQGQRELFDGVHSIIVSVQDRSGNQALDSIQFMVDTTPPEVQFQPPDGTTITSVPVTFEVRIADAGSGMFDNSARIFFNGVERTDRFVVDVTNRFDVFDVGQVAQVIVMTWTPTVEDFVALVRASGDGTLLLEVQQVDRAGNPTVARARYPVDLRSGDGGGGVRIPPAVLLEDARPLQFPLPPRSMVYHWAGEYRVRAVDLARGRSPVSGLPLQFDSSGWGLFVDHPSLTTISNQDGLAGAELLAGATQGTQTVLVRVPRDPSIEPLRLLAEAVDPRVSGGLDGGGQVQMIASSSASAVLTVTAWADRSQNQPLANELVQVMRVDATGRSVPLDETDVFMMPTERLTDGAGSARFLVGTTPAAKPGRHTLRASLRTFPQIYVDYDVVVRSPADLRVPLSTLTSGQVPDRIYTSRSSPAMARSA